MSTAMTALQTFLDEADDALDRDDLPRCIEVARSVELSPELGVAWNGLAYCLGYAGRTAEALQAYAEATRLRPNDFSVFQGYGATLLQAGEVDRAVRTMQRALELRPDSGQTYFLLASALERAGRLDEALEAARKANERLPQDQDVRELLKRLRRSKRG